LVAAGLKQSGFGIASLLISIVAAISLIIASVIDSRLAGSGTTYSEQTRKVGGAVAGLLGMIGIYMPGLGAVLGFFGLKQVNRRKIAVLGLIFNCIVIAAVLGMCFLTFRGRFHL
jgi:hypothetical protein